MNSEYITVSELNRYLYQKFEQDLLLRQVYLQGEISNFKRSGAHYYFSLKDETSEISAMFFYPDRSDLNFIPEDGMSVQVVGKIQVYQKRGTYAIVVSRMEEIGLGLLYQKYLELKEKLEKEGLFDQKYKKPIPEYPEKVGIITALTGEAINDIVSTFNRRLPMATLYFFPAIVQGLDAPKDLIRALNLAYTYEDLDVLIIGRGGGSFEDLNCFNDEALARKLFQAPYPTVSAVGHEGDYTICDFVASFRAPTPTGAAMALTKEKEQVRELINNYSKRLAIGMKKVLTDAYNNWNNLASNHYLTKFDEELDNKYLQIKALDDRLNLLTPENIAIKLDDEIKNLRHNLETNINIIFDNYNHTLNNYSSHLRPELITDKIDKLNNQIAEMNNLMNKTINYSIETKEKAVLHLIEKMTILNPLNIIKNGYAVVYKDDKIIYDIDELNVSDEIKIKLSSGNVYAEVRNIEEDK